MLRHLWVGGDFPGFYESRLRYFVDGETEASVQIPFDLAFGSNMLDDDAPWSAGTYFGKSGQPSGLFNTFQVHSQSKIHESRLQQIHCRVTWEVLAVTISKSDTCVSILPNCTDSHVLPAVRIPCLVHHGAQESVLFRKTHVLPYLGGHFQGYRSHSKSP